MKIDMLGTADLAGWPVAACGCASCRAVGPPRHSSAVRVQDVLEIDHTGVRRNSGVRVDVLPGDEGNSVYLVTAADGERLLYAADSGPLPAVTLQALAGTALVAAILNCGGGRAPAVHGQLDLTSLPAEIVRLRAARVIDAATVIVAAGLSHRNPPESELRSMLSPWGVTLPTEGSTLSAPTTLQAQPRPAGRRTLVTGGVRSGKSTWAELQLAAEPDVSYIATGAPRSDADWQQRLAAHQRRRPVNWRTIETLDLTGELARPGGDALLIDDLGNWVSRTIDATNGWNGDLTGYRSAAAGLVAAWREFAGRVVLVSNEVGAGVHADSRAGRTFADEVGRLNAQLAAESDEVVLAVAGLTQWLRRPAGMI